MTQIKTVTILFSSSQNIGSFAIRKFTRSEWSHCGFLTHTGHVIEATAPAGVVSTPMKDFVKKHNNIIAITITTDLAQLIYDLAAREIGKDYDYTAIFSIAIDRDWQEDDAWFCSELVAYVFYLCKLIIGEEYADLNKITPQAIYTALKKHGTLKVIKGVGH